MENRPPLPPFTLETATQKVQLAEDGWNSKDPVKVASAYTVDCQWRNRAEIFINEKPIGGFTELSQLITNNEFDLTQSRPI